jgi:hypothetical protein
MEINGRVPAEGETFNFHVTGGHRPIQIEVRLKGHLIHQHKCPDPPCHEMVHVPLGAGGNELVVIAQDSSGDTLERKFLVVKPSAPIKAKA